jgi:hypothetical protein
VVRARGTPREGRGRLPPGHHIGIRDRLRHGSTGVALGALLRHRVGGTFAPAIPVLAGLLAGGGSLLWQRLGFLKKRNVLRRALAAHNQDADRPTLGGLGAYYDAQLILLRSEYEFVRSRKTKRVPRSAWLFEASFGFTPEDGFETGPLNVAPDTPGMKALRER